MIRKIAAVSLAVSFLAVATSGMMMFVVEKPSFTLQMHPVHKLFGLVMVVAAAIHLGFNLRPLAKYLKAKPVAIYAGVLVVALVFLYGVALNRKIPADLAAQMDGAAAQAEGHD